MNFTAKILEGRSLKRKIEFSILRIFIIDTLSYDHKPAN